MKDRRGSEKEGLRAGDHVLLLLLAGACWAGSVHGGTVPLDTPWLLESNSLLSPGSLQAIPAIWTDLTIGTRLVLGAEYLPLRDMSVLLDFALFGDSWAGHHLTNLLLYLASCSLFLAVLGDLLGSRKAAWAGAALFALHPAHVESVAWLASRKDVLSLLFFMAAVLAFLRAGRPMLWATVLGLCAYWSKNTAIALPPLLAALSVTHLGGRPARPRWWLDWLPMAAVFGAGLWITIHVGGEVRMFDGQREAGLAAKAALAAGSWLEHLRILLWPAGLSVLYPEPPLQPLASPAGAAGSAVIAACLAGPLLLWKRRPSMAAGLWWFGMGMLPVSQIVPIQNLVADRYLLLPSAGACLLAAAAWPLKSPRWLAAIPACAVLALAALTVERIPAWRSAESLWGDLCTKQPLEPRGWTSLAGHYTDRGEWNKAESVLGDGFEALPGHPELLQGEGLLRLKKGEPDAAEDLLRQALASDPSLRKASNNLAILLHRSHRSEEARKLMDGTLKEHPIYPVGWNTLGTIHLDSGRIDEAEAAFLESVRLSPGAALPLANLGNVAYVREDWSAAEDWWRKSLEADPALQHAKAGLKALERKRPLP